MDDYDYCSDDEDEQMEDEDEQMDDDDQQKVDGEDENRSRQKPYKILTEEDIKKIQEEEISHVCNVLFVSRSVACTLLCQHKWNRNSVLEKWFESPGVVSSEKQGNNEMCQICFETTDTEDNTIKEIVSVACGHPFCVDCWKTYISTSIKDGPGCLELKCPVPKCETRPGLDLVELVSSPDDKHKYYQYLYRSYVELSNSKRKWCPAPGCDKAIEFDGCPDEGSDIACTCGFKFCWRCGDEIHTPLDCDTVAEWMEKNNSEAENTTWILAYTKPCPKCKRPVEKNTGCNHMTCSAPCRASFCWICAQPFNHPNGPCNAYRQGDQKHAKESLERYTHYYERWNANDKSRKIALASLSTARNEHISKLTETQMQPHSQIKFVVEAWEQIVECRRFLKWSYAYGYYRLSGSGSGKKDFFEHLQGRAEVSLERLHHCAEKEMNKYLSEDDGPCEDFNEFRKKLMELTTVAKKFFENLIDALENNLSEVVIPSVKVIHKRKAEEIFTPQEQAFIYAGDEQAYIPGEFADDEAYIAEDYFFNFK